MVSLNYDSIEVILYGYAWIHFNHMILIWLHVNLQFYPSFHYKPWLWTDKSFKQEPNDTPYRGKISNDGSPTPTLDELHENELFYEYVFMNWVGSYCIDLSHDKLYDCITWMAYECDKYSIAFWVCIE